MDRSRIEWTDATWNPVTGCTKTSPGCANCYAERMATRLRAMGSPRYSRGFAVTVHPDLLEQPLRWARPRLVFVNSMSDLFHEDVPAGFIHDVFATMAQARQHTFQILTKRDERLRAVGAEMTWPPNVWVGVTAEARAQLGRLDGLRAVPTPNRFVSFEPLLESLGRVDLCGIGWVIVGGESGPGARPMLRGWVTDIRDQCAARGVPFFFKQWGGTRKHKTGRVLDGRVWEQMPMEHHAAPSLA